MISTTGTAGTVSAASATPGGPATAHRLAAHRLAAVRRIAAAPRTPATAGALLALAATTESIARVAVGAGTRFGLVACLLALSTTLPPMLLRPVAAAVTVCAASVLSLGFFHLFTAAGLVAQVAALYRLGRDGDQHRGAGLLATGLAVPFPVLALLRPAGSETEFLTVLLASLAPAAVWVGIARRARGEALVHRAARQAVANTLLEHTARGERARIARELHDVVAHHISMIAVQAETARLTVPGMPTAGAQRLSEIGDTARAGLTEMRRLLGVLREDAGSEPAQRRPQPGLQQLNELLDEARGASGTAARLIVSGPPAPLDPGVELTAYRIVQEALTNARRHAPGAAVDVELRYGVDALRLRVRDNGPGSAVGARPAGGSGSAGGHGLAGMRERAAAVAGELRAGPAAGGGFLVEATLPAGTAETTGTGGNEVPR